MKFRDWSLLCLDAIMAALLILMFRYQAITSSFHEVCGLILFGLLLLHFFLHFAWMRHVPKASMYRRVRFWLDVVLLILTIAVCVLGIFISRTLGLNSEAFSIPLFRSSHLVMLSYLHSGIAYLMLVTIGIHAGFSLHGVLRKAHLKASSKASSPPKPPSVLGRTISWVVTAILVVAGCYGFIAFDAGKVIASGAEAAFAGKDLGHFTPVSSRGRHDDNPSNPVSTALFSAAIVAGAASVSYQVASLQGSKRGSRAPSSTEEPSTSSR